jgi:muconolactone delta-isomerase
MEYLVTMTTHVPDGTPTEAVDDMRKREAARARELAAARSLLRLWRPPLQPGEWRSLGLFAAQDSSDLEEVLSSMPLRVWRTDEVVALLPHPNDPGPAPAKPDQQARSPEFLTSFDEHIPDGTPDGAVQEMHAAEARRARELAQDGHLLRLWRLASPPQRPRALGLWRARDADELQVILESLPMIAWMKIDTTPLSEHPNDPELRAPPRPDS